ncbi:alpha/beta fold hydrolase [Pedobacter insulae]|uniref:Pimeloyl-ACP methyl ester carboxylesterase n=1 Tax=Pedobacter insulae TaxID=414048 RepID=A0A1I2TMC1_9SPHI|nr:alpha/beta hydrolase [Pedobacter insulae]SFG66018.1 Pimeloyl-ACP methyl ester carboxylesterase [Pedobacter insulae]
MTSHFLNHPIVNLHYYRFGTGSKIMLCFHGYGMHGRQFKWLKEKFGSEYTFYGFDLFFHEQTVLRDNAISNIKKGLTKAEFCEIISSFCSSQFIGEFSLMAYSLGTNYAVVMAESGLFKIEEIFLMAPAFLKIPPVFKVLAKNRLANLFFRKVLLSRNGVKLMLDFSKGIGAIDAKNHEILQKEMSTPDLRFAFYATVTYLRFLVPVHQQLIERLNEQGIKCFFIFGERDSMFPQHIADDMIAKLNFAQKIVLDEDHDLVNANLGNHLYRLKYDH